MKKLTLSLIFLISFHLGTVSAQNRAIVFTEKPWQEILKIAREQQKMIFLDAYTSWCGPCKWMAANIFTNDTVADYYNKTFINAHFDMEKGEGIELARLYQVRAYPTLLFIDGTGAMVHKRVGAPRKISDYIDMGKIALTPGEGFAAYERKFSQGERDPEFLVKYFERLQGAYMPVDGPLNQYFSAVPEEDLIKPQNWKLIYLYVNDIDSREFNYLVKNAAKFSSRYSPDSVDQKLFNTYMQSLAMMPRSKNFTDEAYQSAKKRIIDSGYKNAGKVIFTADLYIFQVRGQTDKYLETASADLEKYYGDDFNQLNETAWYFFQMTKDEKYLRKAAAWAKRSVELSSGPQNNDTYANLLYALGERDLAIKYGTQALELARSQNLDVKSYESNLEKYKQPPVK